MFGYDAILENTTPSLNPKDIVLELVDNEVVVAVGTADVKLAVCVEFSTLLAIEV
jgi:hypothetical protein